MKSSHIVLMLADDMACNHRNPKPATVFSHRNMELNVYGDDVEVDYRGYEVTVENFLRVLTGRFPPSTPRSKRLLSDDRSNILIYMTDACAVVPLISNSFCRYNELLFIIDTCQGASMYERFYSPNVMALASSQVGEDSLSHQPDLAIGVHLMDRYTFYLLEFLEDIHPASQANMNDLGSAYFASPTHQHTQRLRCWPRGSTTVRSPQHISMTTVWIELSRVHLWGLQVGTFRPRCLID
ncbi:UNVERIFIED_CONTAM: hypothetical protein FKN15_026504 [Acipenser sinensis]